MWNSIWTSLSTNAAGLIAAASNVNPYVGGVVALIIAGLLIYVGIKAKQAAWSDEKDQSGGTIGGNTGNDQNNANDVIHTGDDFLNGGKK